MSLNSWLEGTVADTRRAPINHAKIKRKKRRKEMKRVTERARRKGTGPGRAQRALRKKWRLQDRQARER